MSLRLILHREVPEEDVLKRHWNELVLQMERPQVFYTCEWALALQSAYHGSLKPLLFLGYDGDDLVGVASLCTDLGEQQVRFLAGTTGDYCEFLSHPQRRPEFVEAVFSELRRLNVRSLVLANLPANSATPGALRHAAKKYGFHVYIRPAYLCAQVELGSAAQRLELKTSVMRKRQLRRCLRAMEREGVVTLAYLRTWAEVKTALGRFVDAQVARFRTSQRISFLDTSERRLFMEELARRLCDAGVMTLTILRTGEQPIAWSFGFQFQGGWFLYQTTFDTRHQENSPGYCLLAKILIEASENNLNVVDLGLGAEAYKEWFANSTRQTLYATVTTSLLGHLREISRYRLASLVKRSKLEAAIRKARARLRP